MSFINSLFGSNAGLNFQSQQGQLVNPVSGGAVGAVTNAQSTLNQQQQLANALAAQGGIQNQANVYGQLGQIASGQGPNPAAAMLNQQTGQNVANTAALMAGQRGASQNIGLITRQAAEQGAATQQQAVGQGATMQAQQALSALGQQAGIAGQQVGQQINAQQALTAANQAQAGQLIGANVAANQAAIQNAGQANQAQAAIAGQQAQQQGNLISNISPGAALSSLAHGGEVSAKASYDDGGIVDFGADSGAASAPSGAPDASPEKKKAGGIGGLISSILAKGGEVKARLEHFDSGGYVNPTSVPVTPQGPQSSFGRSLQSGKMNTPEWQQQMNAWKTNPTGQAVKYAIKGLSSLFSSHATPGEKNPVAEGEDISQGASTSDTSVPSTAQGGGAAPFGSTSDTQMAKGGKVKAMVSPGEKYLPPNEVKKVEKGEKAAINAGQTIPGKARVPGDSLKNDIIPKDLKEGGIVLPRSVTQSKHPGKEAQKFVETLLRKKGKRVA